jgi:hypothetical protein
LGDEVLVSFLAFDVPVPRVLEGADLAGGVGAVFLVEEGVVALGGVEGRVQIDEVHGLVFEVTAQDVEVVAVVKRAHEASVGKGRGDVNLFFRVTTPRQDWPRNCATWEISDQEPSLPAGQPHHQV